MPESSLLPPVSLHAPLIARTGAPAVVIANIIGVPWKAALVHLIAVAIEGARHAHRTGHAS